jgi:4a-hydroxytetrahydrobiopterin dehydratase
MSELASKTCLPCREETQPLRGEQISHLLTQLTGWKVVNEHHLEKQFAFPDFRRALNFVNQVGDIADREDHHPDIYLAWGRAGITIWTHQVDGLTENDFILAAKIDQL